MKNLKEDLKLNKLPKHIECFDISNTQGKNTVASCIVFKNGQASKKDYRYFKIKTVTGPDDFSSMKEVVYRRYRRLLNEKGNLPELIIIDGGKGQLNAVQEELLFLGFNNLNLASIAKKNEQIFLPGVYEPINLEENSPELFIIQQIRDEAHRFAITFHRSKRSGTSLRSKLDEIEGLGPKRKKALLNRFGSINGIREADLKTLESIPGLPKQVAEKIKETL